jgi:uncharacterized protein (UPF0333 family)
LFLNTEKDFQTMAVIALDFLKKYGLFLLVMLFLVGAVAYFHHDAYTHGYADGSAAVQDKWDQQTATDAAAAASAASAATVEQQSNTQAAMTDAAAGASQQTQVKTVYRTIYQKAETYAQDHPATGNCQLDSVGVSLWNAANAGPGSTPDNPAK